MTYDPKKGELFSDEDEGYNKDQYTRDFVNDQNPRIGSDPGEVTPPLSSEESDEQFRYQDLFNKDQS
jgi:hypothetical protein